jgi:hypothetical protein
MAIAGRAPHVPVLRLLLGHSTVGADCTLAASLLSVPI